MIFPPKLILSFIFLPDEASLKSLTVVEKPPTDDIFPIFFENFVVPYRGPCGFQTFFGFDNANKKFNGAVKVSGLDIPPYPVKGGKDTTFSIAGTTGLQKTEAFTRAGSQRSSWHRVEILAYLSGIDPRFVVSV
ncbi:hypothetical protein FXO37_22776 [Capsicum annuum]|nr:hypothetical protein FXO37_22776 [Capsicum annuum]